MARTSTARMERPCWTICLFSLWLMIIPGAFYTHVSVSKLVPGVQDLPTNIATGFDVILKFALLEQDSQNIANASSLALAKCGVMHPDIGCMNSHMNPQQVNTAAEKTLIQAAFNRSLNTVKKVTSDPYFGVKDLQNTDVQLTSILNKLNNVSAVMTCTEVVLVYCSIHSSSESIVGGISTVNQAISNFKNSDAVESWEKHEDLFVTLHALPYILVVGMLCFTFFWWKGGVCCCCRGGTRAGTIALPFYIIFWGAAFIIWLIVAAVGSAIKYRADKIEVKVLKGNPSLETVIEHLQAKFPEFWDLVFKDVAAGLKLLLPCAYLFLVTTLLIGLYSIFECMCCPYRKKKEPIARSSGAPQQAAGAQA